MAGRSALPLIEAFYRGPGRPPRELSCSSAGPALCLRECFERAAGLKALGIGTGLVSGGELDGIVCLF
jgi:hypothetical protein